MRILLLICFLLFGGCLGKKKKAEKEEKFRGVSLARRPLYNSKKDFRCLDGSGSIPFAWVNDDYCDCDDGTDEPGTSACSMGSFHCLNAGHSPLDIPSSRVNDQVCDCCDGSDEYAGYVKCPNICEELGRKAREEAERQKQVQRQGYEKRQQMMQEGQKQRDKNKKRIEEITKDMDEMRPQREDLETALKEAEAAEGSAKAKDDEAWNAKKTEIETEEARKTFKELDKNGDGKLAFSEVQERIEFDADGDGSVSEEEAKTALNMIEPTFETFRESVWSFAKMTLETKRKVKDPDGEEGVDDFDEDKYLKEGERPPGGVDDAKPAYDEETMKLIDAADKARDEFDKFDKKYQELEKESKDIEDFLSIDLGPNDEFATIRRKCFSLHGSDYVYTLCLFDKSTQSPKGGGMSVNLGKWGEWSGPPDNKYLRMRYTGGESCWNGPDRSTEVQFECGDEDRLLSADEPAKCEYLYRFRTPLGCNEPSALDHDEL